VITTLAEPTPVQEAVSLQADLQRAGISPWAWVVNHALVQAPLTAALMQERAAQQLPYIEAVQAQHSQRLAVVPLQNVEPIGTKALHALCCAS
jgi:arsenite/tail-anchored protein-transporting ATPase